MWGRWAGTGKGQIRVVRVSIMPSDCIIDSYWMLVNSYLRIKVPGPSIDPYLIQSPYGPHETLTLKLKLINLPDLHDYIELS